MSTELEMLYQQVILEHAKRPHGFGLTEGAASESHQLNPTCGDEVTLQLHLTPGSERVQRIGWEGHGCAISQASASLLAVMIEGAEEAGGTSTADLQLRIDEFREMLRSHGSIELDEETFGDAVVLGGVSRYVARVKCAMLAWVAAEHALLQLEPSR